MKNKKKVNQLNFKSKTLVDLNEKDLKEIGAGKGDDNTCWPPIRMSRNCVQPAE